MAAVRHGPRDPGIMLCTHRQLRGSREERLKVRSVLGCGMHYAVLRGVLGCAGVCLYRAVLWCGV